MWCQVKMKRLYNGTNFGKVFKLCISYDSVAQNLNSIKMLLSVVVIYNILKMWNLTQIDSALICLFQKISSNFFFFCCRKQRLGTFSCGSSKCKHSHTWQLSFCSYVLIWPLNFGAPSTLQDTLLPSFSLLLVNSFLNPAGRRANMYPKLSSLDLSAELKWSLPALFLQFGFELYINKTCVSLTVLFLGVL